MNKILLKINAYLLLFLFVFSAITFILIIASKGIEFGIFKIIFVSVIMLWSYYGHQKLFIKIKGDD